jgi:gamma-glutamylcyclotransferase (GGCT)/AIG2-like uncharacterized protein YtfP|tara:strand:+ start:988 stop:1365 length:378 start_codon:yes stop_codon:yes gene_type:complete
MKTNKLAVYGTLRDGKRETWKVDGFNLYFPGHRNYPVAMPNQDASDLVVEVVDVDEQDIDNYDVYEGVSSGLYERRLVEAYKDDKKVKAWMYTIGTLLLQSTGVFQEVPGKDWYSDKCQKLIHLT